MTKTNDVFVSEVKSYGEACTALYSSFNALQDASKGNPVAEKIIAMHTDLSPEQMREEILQEKNAKIQDEFLKQEFTTVNEDLKKSCEIVSAIARDMSAAGVLPEAVDQKLVDNGFYGIANGTIEVKEPSVGETVKNLMKLNKDSITDIKNAAVFNVNKVITLG